MTTLRSDLWLPRASRPKLVAPNGVVIGVSDDPDTTRDALAIVAMSQLGFRYSGSKNDDGELYFQRHCGPFVDLVVLVTVVGETSLAQRYPREGFPWKQGHQPSPELVIEDLFFDTILQLADWPTS